jgi:hypothetical protein
VRFARSGDCRRRTRFRACGAEASPRRSRPHDAAGARRRRRARGDPLHRRREPPGYALRPRRGWSRGQQTGKVGQVGAPPTVLCLLIDHDVLAHRRVSWPLARRMLPRVPTGTVSLSSPATTMRSGRSGCAHTSWEPRWRTSVRPALSRTVLTSLYLFGGPRRFVWGAPTGTPRRPPAGAGLRAASRRVASQNLHQWSPARFGGAPDPPCMSCMPGGSRGGGSGAVVHLCMKSVVLEGLHGRRRAARRPVRSAGRHRRLPASGIQHRASRITVPAASRASHTE